MSIKNNISSYLLSLREGPKTDRKFFSWNQLSKVLIICHDNQLSDCVDFINTCKKDKISVHVAFVYNGHPHQAPSPHFEHTILYKKQFSFFQIPNKKSLEDFNLSAYDLLINLGNANQLQTLAISKLVKAKCKISSFRNQNFDLIIEINNSMKIADFLKQVVVYLKMIKTS
jgi:hypothetical protein